MTSWILFSSVSVFHYLSRNSLGPSIPHILPSWRTGLSILTDLMSFYQVNSSRMNPPEGTVPTTFLSSAQMLAKYFFE